MHPPASPYKKPSRPSILHVTNTQQLDEHLEAVTLSSKIEVAHQIDWFMAIFDNEACFDNGPTSQ